MGKLKPGLVVFDVIYGMGMADDTGTGDVMPVLAALKRISAEFGAATLAIGHSGHNGERRFRGSSVWRQQAAVEWHMAHGELSCEKSKNFARAEALELHYVLSDWPSLTWRTDWAEGHGRRKTAHHRDSDAARRRRSADHRKP